jgi:DNA-binding response OmpR family regulator
VQGRGGPARRKVLIIEDEPSIRNALYVLLAGLGCEGDVAYTGQQALSMISRETFDAVLLDLRCNNLTPDQVVSEIKELRPNLVGRVLVITGEVTDPQTMELIERHFLPHVPGSRLKQELWERLRTLLGPSTSPHTIR